MIYFVAFYFINYICAILFGGIFMIYFVVLYFINYICAILFGGIFMILKFCVVSVNPGFQLILLQYLNVKLRYLKTRIYEDRTQNEYNFIIFQTFDSVCLSLILLIYDINFSEEIPWFIQFFVFVN